MDKSGFIAALLLAATPAATAGCGSGSDDLVGAPVATSDAGPDQQAGDDASDDPDADAADPALDPDAWNGTQSDGGRCRPSFASGVNVAWIRFARDVPNPDLGSFRQLFHNTYAAGGRVARWWFHTDGTTTPGYDADGMALPISGSDIADVKSILDTARDEHMMVVISLWSFDMLKANSQQANNVKLLTVDANRQAYIDNVLTPLAQALAGDPGLYAWETFNEPEGMATGVNPSAGPFTGTGGTSVDESFIQKTVNAFAGAIHDADPGALVTNGTWQFLANANVTGMTNFYSDAALRGVPNARSNGTLDFYEVHYYAQNGARVSPYLHPASYWQLDKPLVIGEFYALAQDSVDAGDTYTALLGGGYGGAWAWQYWNDDRPGMTTKWPTMQVPLENLYALAPADVDCP